MLVGCVCVLVCVGVWVGVRCGVCVLMGACWCVCVLGCVLVSLGCVRVLWLCVEAEGVGGRGW